MRKNLIRTGAALAGLAAGTFGFAACGVDSNPSMTIAAFHKLKLETDGCTFSDLPVGGGTFDAGWASEGYGSYILYMRVDNNMHSNEDEEVGRLNTNKIQLTDIEISVANHDRWPFLPKKQVQAAGILIDSDTQLFKSVVPFDQTWGALMVQGRDGHVSPIAEEGSCADMLLTFKTRGMLMDGTNVESNEINFGVTVCNRVIGCPENWLAEGCSFVQPDGFTCKEPTGN